MGTSVYKWSTTLINNDKRKEDNSMRIIAYTYEGDVHCIDCTVKRYKSHGFCDRYGEEWYSNYHARLERPRLDSEGVHVYIHDNEGNLVHPLFSTDEWYDINKPSVFADGTCDHDWDWQCVCSDDQDLICGDCHKIIDTYTVEGVTV